MYRHPTEPNTPGPSRSMTLAERRRAHQRHDVELLVRFAWNGLRGTAMVRDLTRYGARIEGVGALRKGDWLTLLMPGLKATYATVAWTAGSSAGLTFEDALESEGFEAVIADFATLPQADLTNRRAA